MYTIVTAIYIVLFVEKTVHDLVRMFLQYIVAVNALSMVHPSIRAPRLRKDVKNGELLRNGFCSINSC